MIVLGKQVKDKISGFTGVATCRSEFINGCVRISIQPPLDKDGKFQDERWFDEQQIEMVGDGVKIKTNVTGGPTTSIPNNRG